MSWWFWRKVRYLLYLESPRWKALRAIRRRIDGNRCTQCGRTDRLQVHHTRYRKRQWLLGGFFRELLDLRTLCVDCHKAAHANVELREQWSIVLLRMIYVWLFPASHK